MEIELSVRYATRLMMVVLTTLNNERACLAFTDFLAVKGVHHEIEKHDNHFTIKVAPDQFEQAHAWLERFLQHPDDAIFQSASWQRNLPHQTHQAIGLKALWQSAPNLTRFITVLCIALFGASVAGYFQTLMSYLSFDISLVEPYRLITPAFLHLNLLHLIFNLAWWWYLAGRVETVLGPRFLVGLLIGSAALSNLSQAWLMNDHFAGLSGVNYALAGFVWLYGVLTNHKVLQLGNGIMAFLILWMLLGFAQWLPLNMANWAHFSGLLVGLAVAHIMLSRRPPSDKVN